MFLCPTTKYSTCKMIHCTKLFIRFDQSNNNIFFLHETLDLTHVRSVEKKEMKNMKRDTIRYFLLIKATNAWNKKSAINLTNRYANDTDTHSPNATKSMWKILSTESSTIRIQQHRIAACVIINKIDRATELRYIIYEYILNVFFFIFLTQFVRTRSSLCCCWFLLHLFISFNFYLSCVFSRIILSLFSFFLCDSIRFVVIIAVFSALF